jgi:hypothetical protein
VLADLARTVALLAAAAATGARGGRRDDGRAQPRRHVVLLTPVVLATGALWAGAQVLL